MKENKNKYLRNDLFEKNTEAFDRIFGKITDTLIDVISSICSNKISDNLKESTKDVVQITHSFIQAKLQHPSIENDKLMAEIFTEYSIAELNLASVEKIKAETESLKTENAEKKLELILETMLFYQKLGAMKLEKKIVDTNRK